MQDLSLAQLSPIFNTYIKHGKEGGGQTSFARGGTNILCWRQYTSLWPKSPFFVYGCYSTMDRIHLFFWKIKEIIVDILFKKKLEMALFPKKNMAKNNLAKNDLLFCRFPPLFTYGPLKKHHWETCATLCFSHVRWFRTSVSSGGYEKVGGRKLSCDRSEQALGMS